jgi:prolyl 4-hydroxylase
MSKLSDWIKVYDDAIPDHLVQACLDYFQTSPKGEHNQEWRRCKEVTTLDSSPLWIPVKEAIASIYHRYREECRNSVLNFANIVEAPNIFCYHALAPTKNYFNEHADAWSLATSTRQVSIIIYLNDVQEGGSTTFTTLGVSVAPKRGRILLFPSHFAYLHCGEAPLSEDKYIIVTWIHFDGQGHAYRSHRL